MAMAYQPVGFSRKPRLALLLLTITFPLQFTRVVCGDTLRQGEELAYGGLLKSLSGEFALGFSDDIPKYLKLGFNFFTSVLPDVWVADPNNPIHQDSKPRLVLDDYGNLKILYNKSDFIPIYTSGLAYKINATATLGDNGNLIVANVAEMNEVLWQSIDYPNNVLLPGMSLGINNKTGHKWSLTAGSFTFGIDPYNKQQLTMWQNGTVYWSSGPLRMKHGKFSNLKAIRLRGPFIFYFNYYSDEDEKYFLYNAPMDNRAYIALSPEGYLFGEASVYCNGSNPMFDTGCVRPGPGRPTVPPNSLPAPGEPKSKVNVGSMRFLRTFGFPIT